MYLIFESYHQNAEENHNIRVDIANTSFEKCGKVNIF